MKLLIIEDSPRLSKTLETGFSSMGFVVDCAQNGKDGLAYALTEDYAAIILDLMLPDIDGLTILREIRRKSIFCNILILSAKDDIDDRVEGLNAGADDYLCKPFSFKELHARINTLIRRKSNIKSDTVYLLDGCVVLNLALKTLKVGDIDIKLTKNEYSIIEMLALNQGRTITYSQIEQQTHDSATSIGRNSIEVHVSALRKKLKSQNVSDLIKTQRSFGYYIE